MFSSKPSRLQLLSGLIERSIPVTDLFCGEDRRLFPDHIVVSAVLQETEADIDVVICGYSFPELTNAAMRSYLLHERESRLHIIVVESSGKTNVFEQLYAPEQVSRILIQTDISITDRKHGNASYGMALSAAIGQYFSRAPYVFFSHSDMMAYQDNFLTFLRSKLTGGVRLASFTQRHVIPFTGCMLVGRELLQQPGLDWLPNDRNPYTYDKRLSALSSAPDTPFPNINYLDCGEAYIYSEIAHNVPVYVCASRGGSEDWWKDPFGYFRVTSEQARLLVQRSGCNIHYAPLRITREGFQHRYASVLRASRFSWWQLRQSKFWRYSFDDDGRLLFVHHGRGTTRRNAARWLQFVNRHTSNALI